MNVTNKQTMNNKVTNKQVMDAIQYLWGTGATLQMRSDDQHYTEILIEFAAEKLGVELWMDVE